MFLFVPPSSDAIHPIVDNWQFKNDQVEIVAEFLQDGTFRRVNSTSSGKETFTDQAEYVIPFTKKVELDTSAYRHRWMNNHGDILCTDENTHNPNEYEKRPNYEWKQTPASPH